jgi:hypothetical protein
MIPALFAAPMVQGIVGSVVGGVSGAFAPSAPAQSAPPAFSPYMDRVAKPAAPSAATSPTGMLRSEDLSRMNATEVQTWANSLAGHHVDATDASGRTISGLVSGMQQMGHTPALNIGGHLVSLSQLKQISWSPAVA